MPDPVLRVAIVDADSDLHDLLNMVEAEMHEAAIDVNRTAGVVGIAHAVRLGTLTRIRTRILGLMGD